MPQNTPFNQVEVRVPQTNYFDLSHDNKLSLDMGKIYPCLVMETIPGDHLKITPEAIVRMAPMLYPLMHKVDVFIHLFFVPYRILWSNWEKFVGGENVTPPYIQGHETPLPQRLLNVDTGSLLDYLNLPTATNILEKILALPITAYYSIINQYYQDQNNDSFYITLRDILEALKQKDGLLLPTDYFSSTDAAYEFGFANRAWEHDYFTSALPFAQKGPSVKIPITLSDLPVKVTNIEETLSHAAYTGQFEGFGGILTDPTNTTLLDLTGLADGGAADLSGTINQLRVSYALQRYYELNARAGTRYNEIMRGRWGVNIKDERISRPEYIGGVKNNIIISEVLQTSSTTPSENALGEYAGHGTGVLSGNTVEYYCPENGVIMGLISVIPKTAYFQGIPKMYSRITQTDFFQPEFAHIGEQAVLNKEIYYDPALTDNNDEFGYMPMGSELKYIPSGVHGQFRTTFLPFHLARKFDNRPQLNEDFIYCRDDKRIFAVQDPEENSLYSHIFFQIEANRKIPYYSTPI